MTCPSQYKCSIHHPTWIIHLQDTNVSSSSQKRRYFSIQFTPSLLGFRSVNWNLLTLPCLCISSTVPELSSQSSFTSPFSRAFCLTKTAQALLSVCICAISAAFNYRVEKEGGGISEHLLCILEMQREGLGTLGKELASLLSRIYQQLQAF